MDGIYEELLDFVGTVMEAAKAEREFSIDKGFILIARAGGLPGCTDVLHRRAIYTRESGESHGFTYAVVLHSVNVAIYAVKIGEGLSYNRDQLIDLGVASLLHDVGKITLSEEIFSAGALTDEVKTALNQHPIKGLEILSKLGEEFGWIIDVARQEHEREDGSGYPEGLSGNQIHHYAKIIGVADTYAGLTRS